MDHLKPLIDALHAEGRLRVWSLVITAFGDSVQHRGGRISTMRLGLLLGRIGIEPGALRTALSRLGRDGWVSSERQGRASLYRLTDKGAAEYRDASPRIYAAPVQGRTTEWALSLDDDPKALKIGGLSLRPAAAPHPETGFRMTGQLEQIAPAVRNSLLPPDHLAALRALLRDLDSLPPNLSPLDAAAARTLLIHRWRRIVLRFAEVPPDLLPDDLPCPRRRMAEAYAALTPGAEDWLSTALPDIGAMPPPDASFARRFDGNA